MMRVMVVSVAVVLAATACGGGAGEGEGLAPETLGMRDYFFEPDEWRLPEDGTTVALDNRGVALHNLRIEDAGIDVDVASGEEVTVDLGLPAGTYSFECKYHIAQGMTGTLTVE